MAHISWSHNILFQVLETDPHHPALPLFTIVNIVEHVGQLGRGQRFLLYWTRPKSKHRWKQYTKSEYRGSSLQYPIKYTPPIYEGLKPHSIRLQESILKVHLHLSSPPPHECQMQDVKIFLWDVYLPDVSHHHVDESVFYQTQEHEKCAGGHEHVNGLKYKITPNM